MVLNLTDVIIKEDKLYVKNFIEKQSKIYEKAGFGKIKLNYTDPECRTEFLAHSFIKKSKLYIIVYSLETFNNSEYKEIIVDMEVANANNKNILKELQIHYDASYILEYLLVLRKNTLCMLKDADDNLKSKSVITIDKLITEIKK